VVGSDSDRIDYHPGGYRRHYIPQLRGSRQNIVDWRVGSIRSPRTHSLDKFSISQKVLGTLPKDGNVMPKHVEATIHN
jgi:hypothetical protein